MEQQQQQIELWSDMAMARFVLRYLAEAASRTRPSPLRQRLLRRYVTAESITAGREVKHGRSRYFLLLLLVDRPRDMLKLIYRTLWPEDEWLNARYSGQANRWRHLWNVVRYGRV